MKARHVSIYGWGEIEMVELTRHETEDGVVYWTMDEELFDEKYRSMVSYNVFIKEKRVTGGYWYTNNPWTVVFRLEHDRT